MEGCKMTKIFITINPSFHNKGDGAILFGALRTLRMLDNAEITLLSSHSEYDRAQSEKMGLSLNIISTFNHSSERRYTFSNAKQFLFSSPFFVLSSALCRLFLYKIFRLKYKGFIKKDVWEEYCKSDIVIVSLNGTFTTMYGLGGFANNFYSIALTKTLKKPVVIYAASIEPFKNKLWEILGKYIINKVDLITLREERSYKYLQKIGVTKPPMHVTTDLAFLVQSASPERVKEIMSIEGINKNNEPLIGMTVSHGVSHWAFPELTNSEERYIKYIEVMAKVVDYLVDNLSATIVFIPHSITPYDEDRDVGKDIYEKVKNKHKVKVITNDYTSAEIKGIISQCDLVVGARTHSVILATSMCIPSILVAGSIHKPGIISEILGQEKWVYNETLDFDTLVSKINKLWSNRDEIRRELKPKAENMEERALFNGELVKKLMDSLKRSS
jgi:polysaccharide pyruvyl transferase WcaK-like protein